MNQPHPCAPVVSRTRAALLALSLVACGDESTPLAEPVASGDVDSQPIVHGRASKATQDAVVMLAVGDEGVCTGTLVAPNLVLTARHCVAETEAEIACAPDGRPLAGGRIGADYPPRSIVVRTGPRRSKLVTRARGARLFHDGADNLCDHDLALVLLDQPIDDVPVAALRLDETTQVGERITAVGWGLTARGREPSARLERRDVPVLDVGPSSTTPPHQLRVGESICSGDSGGPAISAAGAVIGVVSYGGNGSYDERDPAASCLDAAGQPAINAYTRLAPFADLLQAAFRAAGHEPLREPSSLPMPPG